MTRARPALLVALLAALLAGAAPAPPPPVELELFTREGCPRCAGRTPSSPSSRPSAPGLRVTERDVGGTRRRASGSRRRWRSIPACCPECPPSTCAGKLLVGFGGPETSGRQLRALVDAEPGAAGATAPGPVCPQEGSAPCPEPDAGADTEPNQRLSTPRGWAG